eukprot:1139595-Pelagomonas_calceolata.AAC.1
MEKAATGSKRRLVVGRGGKEDEGLSVDAQLVLCADDRVLRLLLLLFCAPLPPDFLSRAPSHNTGLEKHAAAQAKPVTANSALS